MRHRHSPRRPSGRRSPGLGECVAIACDRLASHFGQTGSIAELYRHYGVNAIVAAAEANLARPTHPPSALPGVGERYRKARRGQALTGWRLPGANKRPMLTRQTNKAL